MKKKSEPENTEKLIDSLPSSKKDRGIASLLLRCCLWPTSSGENHLGDDERVSKHRRNGQQYRHPDSDPPHPHTIGNW